MSFYKSKPALSAEATHKQTKFKDYIVSRYAFRLFSAYSDIVRCDYGNHKIGTVRQFLKRLDKRRTMLKTMLSKNSLASIPEDLPQSQFDSLGHIKSFS